MKKKNIIIPLAEWDWVGRSGGDYIHHLARAEAPRRFLEACGGMGETTCGRYGHFVIPGILTRIGAERCPDCCERLGIHEGRGSPKNDENLRPWVKHRISEADELVEIDDPDMGKAALKDRVETPLPNEVQVVRLTADYWKVDEVCDEVVEGDRSVGDLLRLTRTCLDALEMTEEKYEGESMLDVLEYVSQYHEHRVNRADEPHDLYARVLRTLVGGDNG